MSIAYTPPLTLKYLCMYHIQKVLPAVYDDSLSYYELLAKVQDKLNEVVGDLNNLNEWQSAQDEALSEMESMIREFIDGGYREDFDTFAQQWLDENISAALENATKMVFFGLTTDGYFCAYIPTKYSFVFDTVMDYDSPNYGRLTIKY